ncbi:signal peptidase I [Chloroflexota bacterium]
MKRALGLIIIVVACIIGFLSIRGVTPFMPISGTSMEPAFKAGDLILIERVSPSQIKEGDVIVYNVTPLVQDAYNFPPVIAHRVIRISTFDNSVAFRTKGDNTGEDPITVRAGDLRGKVSDQIPYLGFPLLFFQSKQGLIFAVIALSLLALFLYTDEISLGGTKLQRGIFTPVIRESYRTNRIFSQKLEATEQKVDATEQALGKFASAIELYAQHLASHTSAIQGLSEASHELKRSSAEQNRVLMLLSQTMEQKTAGKEIAAPLPEAPDEGIISEIGLKPPEPEEIAPEPDKPIEASFPPGCIKSHLEPAEKNKGHRPRHPDISTF